MISNIYKKQLKNKAKKIDEMTNSKAKFEILVNEITEMKIDQANLDLIKQLGDMKQLKNMDKSLTEDFIETLYKYHGSLQIELQIEQIKDTVQRNPQDLFNQLNELIGLNNVKQVIYDLIDFNKIQQLRISNGLKTADRTLHMAFLGNPGTAKTTVARIVGQLYHSFGFLSKGHFIEVGRTDLIAEYQGQTAIKVKRLIERAKGGVLFIDEAYSITENDSNDSYGRESLTELTKALEDNRDDLVVIVAGYPDLMDDFFESNPGLKSRFNTFINFEDYSINELMDIFLFIANKNEYEVEDKALYKLRSLIEEELEKQDKYFANGRFIRNLFDDVIMNQSKRLIGENSEITIESLKLIKESDF